MDNLVEQEFLAAYDAYADALYKHCFFRVYSAERAEDLVQETFTKTWNYLVRGQKIDNMRAFLYKTANNLIIDYARKKHELSLEQELANNPGWEPSDHGPSPEHQALLFQVRESLNRLPSEARQLLTWRFIDDLDPKDIAVILEITPNNVSVKITRAIKLLQNLYKDLWPSSNNSTKLEH